MIEAGWNAFSFSLDFLAGGFLTRQLRSRCCAKKTDIPALVMRFCVPAGALNVEPRSLRLQTIQQHVPFFFLWLMLRNIRLFHPLFNLRVLVLTFICLS